MADRRDEFGLGLLDLLALADVAGDRRKAGQAEVAGFV
jgi:hypothetical protein